jgi:hypothetical protein
MDILDWFGLTSLIGGYIDLLNGLIAIMALATTHSMVHSANHVNIHAETGVSFIRLRPSPWSHTQNHLSFTVFQHGENGVPFTSLRPTVSRVQPCGRGCETRTLGFRGAGGRRTTRLTAYNQLQ